MRTEHREAPPWRRAKTAKNKSGFSALSRRMTGKHGICVSGIEIQVAFSLCCPGEQRLQLFFSYLLSDSLDFAKRALSTLLFAYLEA